jgi:hypothetical protein
MAGCPEESDNEEASKRPGDKDGDDSEDELEDAPQDPTCAHQRIDVIGGGGDEFGVWETLQCPACGWTFSLKLLDDKKT